MTLDRECHECNLGFAVEGSAYCEACHRRFAQLEEHGRRRQRAALRSAGSRMQAWTLATFPTHDEAGRAAITAVEPWLWSHTGHRLVDGRFVKIDEENPAPEIDFDNHPIWKSFHAEIRPNLYVHGPVGSGKSGLAFSLIRARVELFFDWETPKEDPAWVNVVELLDRAKAAMSTGDGGAVIRDYYMPSLLVLDDLGAERPSDWARDAIAALVQYRHARDLPTIVTSNYAPSALARRLGHDDQMIGQRIVSRLTENCIKHKLDRTDLRLRSAAA
jgi:hypothetical protein